MEDDDPNMIERVEMMPYILFARLSMNVKAATRDVGRVSVWFVASRNDGSIFYRVLGWSYERYVASAHDGA